MITQSTPEVGLDNLGSFMTAVRPDIERALVNNLPIAPPQIERSFGEAMRAALFSGGKRIRPVLTMLGAQVVGGTPLSVLGPATAVEYIHTSSLIFDDLPCMDDTIKRRGKPALHVQYGEGMAVLVALALLNKAYSLVLEKRDSISDRSLLCHSELTRCVEDQIFGQALDIISTAAPVAPVEREGIQSLRNLKASALVRLSLILGAICSDARAECLTTLSRFAALLGDAYQISDDINDKVEDGDLPGQPRHATLLTEHGEESAKLRVAALTKEAKEILVSAFGLSPPTVTLCGIADYVIARCR
jgi:geranylgeranyl pyrophosphate synthase